MMINEDIIYVKPENLMLINNKELKTFPFYEFLLKQYKNKKELNDSNYFKYYENQLKNNNNSLRINKIKNKKDIISRLEYLLNLKELIKKDPEFKEIEKVEVFIDEVGTIRIFEGCHRSIISLVLGIEKIPVKVIHRHKIWEDFKEQNKKEYNGNIIYNEIMHPDFDNFERCRQDRFKPIFDFISNYDFYNNTDLDKSQIPTYEYKFSSADYFQKNHSERVKGLDIGCHFGYLCHKFAKERFIMTGIETHPDYYKAAKYLNRVYNSSVDFINQDARSFMRDENVKFDFVIMLSVFYYFYRINRNLACNLLTDIYNKSKVLFIDSDVAEMPVDLLLKLIKENTKFKTKLIFDGIDGRKIYACVK